ncbi:MAG: hypothetical protein LBT21_07645 [Oscillospiraceae bacterium]|nr:hypothetical protein [Oscillospiraceae bacterium]
MLGIELMIAITDRSYCDDFVALFEHHGLPLTLIALGEGTAPKETLEMLGLVDEPEKAVLFSVARYEKIRKTLKDLRKSFGIRAPGTSVALTIPLSSVAGHSVENYLSFPNRRFESEEHLRHHLQNHQHMERNEKDMSDPEAFELIIAIANNDYGDMVVEAATTRGGATGATLIRARGVSAKEDRHFFGISLADEKEMVLIVCRAACKNKIMKAIADYAGLQTKAKAIVFSVPVSAAEGLWILEDEDNREER